jgi:hypothetical protein
LTRFELSAVKKDAQHFLGSSSAPHNAPAMEIAIAIGHQSGTMDCIMVGSSVAEKVTVRYPGLKAARQDVIDALAYD